MYPSKPNANTDTSSKDLEVSKPPGDPSYGSSSPSAPLLPSSPYNPAVPNMDPPSYNSVVAQDSSDWKNRSSSFSGGNNSRPYPPASPHITGAKSTSGLDIQPAPYPTGPGLPQGHTNQAPYPAGGYSSQAPYPTAPGDGPPHQGNTAPYPTGPGLGSGITSQPPYATGSGPIPGFASQPPYPTVSMPMPGLIDNGRQIGFTNPVTTEPKSANVVYPPATYGQGPTTGSYNQGLQPGEIHEYAQHSQYAANSYQQQQQQPQTIYVVQKQPERSSVDDDCCLLACCMASCYCICECIKVCASD